MKEIILKHLQYMKNNHNFNKRIGLPFYNGLNLFTRVGNLIRDLINT